MYSQLKKKVGKGQCVFSIFLNVLLVGMCNKITSEFNILFLRIKNILA
jgi:hypothetical protein